MSHGKGSERMKLFLREHAVLIIVQFIQFLLIVSIFWLSGFRNMKIILYSVFLGSFLLLLYLLYYYFSRRKFYERLSKPVGRLDESLQELDQAPIAEKLYELLKTQYYEYEKQIINMSEKQEEHLSFIDRWIHQMKTPLSVIELMAKELDEPESSSFREETDRIKNGLNMSLYMARLKTIEQDLQIEKITLLPLIQEVSQDNKRLFIRNNVYPEIKTENEKIVVESDEKWLFFMVTQLIQNAVKYSAGKSTHIEISIHARPGQAIVEVEDYGVGIPKEDLKRIFNPFYTGVNGRKFRESTGVGLFLVKEVAAYLGHNVEVKSKVGSGSIFRIVF